MKKNTMEPIGRVQASQLSRLVDRTVSLLFIPLIASELKALGFCTKDNTSRLR